MCSPVDFRVHLGEPAVAQNYIKQWRVQLGSVEVLFILIAVQLESLAGKDLKGLSRAVG